GFLTGGQPQRFEFLQALEAVANGAIVRQGAAQPALADEGHAAACRLAFDGLLGLALGADEQHQAAAARHLGQVTVRAEQAANRLTQIDDMDEIALAVNVRPHLWVPAASPMAKMHTRLDEILNLDNRHALPSCQKARKRLLRNGPCCQRVYCRCPCP